MSSKVESVEERKAGVLIKLRKYKLISKEKFEGAYAYIINIPQDKEKAIVWCILGEATVGIVAMNALYKVMKEKDINRALVVTEGRQTRCQEEKRRTPPQIIPSFRYLRARACSKT